jgi:outer membrane biogenesis lipoprotein LolB
MKKKGLLVLLVLIFLCACSFIGGKEQETKPFEESLLLQDYDEIVKKAEDYVNQPSKAVVESVYQHESDTLWKIEFTNGLIVIYNETTDELTHTDE